MATSAADHAISASRTLGKLGAAGRVHSRIAYFQLFSTILEVVWDVLGVLLALCSSYWLYHVLSLGHHVSYRLSILTTSSIIVGIFFATVLKMVGGYQPSGSLMRIRETEHVLRASVTTFLLLSPIMLLTQTLISRWFIVISLFAIPLFVIVGKQVFFGLGEWLHEHGIGAVRVVIYGANAACKNLFTTLSSSPKLGLKAVAIVDDDAEATGGVMYASGYRHDKYLEVRNEPLTAQLLREHEAEMLIVAVADLEPRRVESVLAAAEEAQVDVATVPGTSVWMDRPVEILELDGVPLLRLGTLRSRMVYDATKRVFDLVLSSVMMIVLLPILLLIAAIIKIDSRGPVFFRQVRVGKNGRQFPMYKFRTMKVEECGDAYSPSTSSDPRITRVGKYLRSLSLDELPQLVNVLRGEMSLVGPRPEMPFIVANYEDKHWRRLVVKPGLTGLWQLSADRRYLIHENIHYDLYYVRNRNFFLDFAILLHTFFFAMRGI